MGCHASADQCDHNEKPERTVRLNGYWLGKPEGTQGPWHSIMGGNSSRFKEIDNHPVEQVSWNDLQEFIPPPK